ncbi:hypothetical protein Pedsa_2491 [Pseudopedobacter saltans DSM 12145]|uniref:DUF4906 domain-containing protein n=1 Tax=Pseudopedobacter saltans (strain ATCC 51119 / DSM 12145 / JCM 21818 / CCUG 39354 / LMG 10337 / NBRC 100064 / NCIMB 13643) TaxID=762903 RepID=F0SEX0_PSESL|nr:hypothetical protein [Pseudopedobacter saltans]ADY53036.1 hypothetical protein Pedsa_2491 [Pseudopedobacter saltans DSM 12145]
MRSKKLLLLLFCYLSLSACKDSLTDVSRTPKPSDLKYVAIGGAREGKSIVTAAPTVQTGGLLPKFELVSIAKEDGSLLDDSFLSFVTIGSPVNVSLPVKPNTGIVDENGNPVNSMDLVNSASNGVISIATGHNFSVGDYYFNIKVTTEKEGIEYSTVFDKAFHLNVGPLLPTNLIYSPKNQNLVYGVSGARTSAPMMPNANPDVHFELGSYTDKLIVDRATGEISIAPGYVYSKYDTLSPIIKVVSNISNEVVAFQNKLTVIITNKAEPMPIETIYLFYPTLNVTTALPTGGDGYSVQTDNKGLATRIWGIRANSSGSAFVKPAERPATNTGQTILETQTHSGTNETEPTNAWMVTTTQDLTAFQYGYKLSFNYYYMPAFQTYMADGRTPTDLEVYISKDYTGGDIQDANGNWLNGTWTKVNASIKCQRAEGVSGSNSSGAPWGPEFVGTPYPGDQTGIDPEGRKKPGTTFYGKWVKCSYEISSNQISSNFTVAFKVASYFQGKLTNTAAAPGRGGIYFLSDFNYKAVEPTK